MDFDNLHPIRCTSPLGFLIDSFPWCRGSLDHVLETLVPNLFFSRSISKASFSGVYVATVERLFLRCLTRGRGQITARATTAGVTESESAFSGEIHDDSGTGPYSCCWWTLLFSNLVDRINKHLSRSKIFTAESVLILKNNAVAWNLQIIFGCVNATSRGC